MSYYHLNPNRPGEAMARHLEQTRDYRVLRRLPRLTEFWCRSMPNPGNTMRIAVIDCETTGLDARRHKLIEIAVAKLTIDLDQGDVVNVSAPISWLEDPGEPLTPEIEALTGISDGDVRGEAFNDELIARALDDADVLVSHNARFDRGFLVRRFPRLGHPWACSVSEVDWAGHGLAAGGRSIGALLTSAGHFLTDAHRAGPDTWALTCLLSMTAADGRVIAAHLIDAARRPTQRLYARGAPFSVKDALKAGGYRWSVERRAWWTEGDPERICNEIAWLRELHPLIRPEREEIDWYNRHSS